jgi:hypothetical protein
MMDPTIRYDKSCGKGPQYCVYLLKADSSAALTSESEGVLLKIGK